MENIERNNFENKIFSKILILFVIFFILFSGNIYSQKVGLVLSGGGAKGLAHIGVIKVLEENNIPIDYISGTSMGAIIGGLYSIGYTTNEMEKLVKSEDFLRWSNGEIEKKYMYYFKKSDPNSDIISLNMRIKEGGPQALLPSNIIPTHQLDFVKMELFGSACSTANNNFDSLFVPFRCVASDIYNKKAVVFSKGNLGSAIRASMTFPFYFKPIKINDVLLFDGGMQNNFPWDVLVNDFNPDYIIGSKTANNSGKPDANDITGQLENMLLSKSNYNLPENGILINIDFKNIELLDFDKADFIIQKGYNAALTKIDSIKSLIPNRIDSNILTKRREKFKSKLNDIIFKDIDISGLNSKERIYLKKNLYHKDSIFDIKQFKTDYFKLLADGTISSIYPTEKYNLKSGFFDLNLKISEKNKVVAKLGGNISSSSINQGFAAVEYNHLGTYAKFLSANIYYGRLYSSVKLNGRIDLPGRMPFALTTSFTMNRWDYYNSSPDPFFEDVRPSYLINNERNVKVELSTPVKYNGVVKIGYSRSRTKNSYYQIKSFNKADTADITYFDADNLSLKFEKNTLNRKQYPTKGEYNLIKFNYIKGYEDFVSGSTSNLEDFNNSLHYWLNLELVHDKYFNLGNHFTLGYLAKAVISNKSFFGNYTSTILSSQAFTPTPHSKTLFIENLRLNNYLALGIKPIININSLIDLRFEMYGYLPYKKIISVNNGIAEYDKEFSDYSYLMSSSLVFNTIVGPASFSVNYYEKDDKNLYFIFNFGYIIFNKKGI